MKKLFLPFLLLAFSAKAQDRMTPEMLWSLKRVSADELSKTGKTLYYTTKQYDWTTEKSAVKHYKLNIASGSQTELSADDLKKLSEKKEITAEVTAKNELRVVNNKTSKTTDYPISDADNIKVSPDNKYIVFSREVLVTPVKGTDIYKDLPKDHLTGIY